VCVFLGCLFFCAWKTSGDTVFFGLVSDRFNPFENNAPPKLNSSPLKKLQERLVGFSSNHHFSGAILLLNFGEGSQLASFPQG